MLKLRHEQAKIEVDYENSSAEELYVLGISFLYDGRFYFTERQASVSEWYGQGSFPKVDKSFK